MIRKKAIINNILLIIQKDKFMKQNGIININIIKNFNIIKS